jgi:hypothetical protein
MVKWEYSVYMITEIGAWYAFENDEEFLEHNGTIKDTLKHLDTYGQRGWEVISVKFEDTTTTYHLMRPFSQE